MTFKEVIDILLMIFVFNFCLIMIVATIIYLIYKD